MGLGLRSVMVWTQADCAQPRSRLDIQQIAARRDQAQYLSFQRMN